MNNQCGRFLHAYLAHASGRTYVFDPLQPTSLSEISRWSRKKVQPLSSVINVGKTWDTTGGECLYIAYVRLNAHAVLTL
jgi:hypothetical protein